MTCRRFGFLLTFFGFVLAASLAAQVFAQQTPSPVQTVSATADALDEPISWLIEARRNFTAVQNFTCTLLKREQIQGRLDDENIIQMKFRAAPYSVYMRWLAPTKFNNQEVCFVQGKNKEQMRVHAKGILGVAGFVTVDVNDRRVMEHSRHTILEAGIGNLIELTLKAWQKEREVGKTQVKVGEYTFNGRRCLRIETTRLERRPDSYCYRSVIYLDKDSKLPIRNEAYDWPRQGGSAEGELLEMFSYVDLSFNVPMSDADFSK